MEATCTHCGTRHRLNDQQIAGHTQVQFRCSKCGQTTVTKVARAAASTMVVSGLPPAFSRSDGVTGEGTDLMSTTEGLELPADKTITLTVTAGPSKGQTFRLEKPRVILGREGADFAIGDPGVSRRHCAVEVRGEVVRLRDLDSTNGIFYDEERVRVAELSDNSEFRIGSTVLQVSITPKQS